MTERLLGDWNRLRSDIYVHLERFFDHVKQEFHLRNVEIVKKEGYSASLSFGDRDRIWLGERNFLMVGDAAGLIDLTRGVGMDAAALSGRLAAKAIDLARKNEQPVIDVYSRLMSRVVDQTRRNQQRGITNFRTNEMLQEYLDKGLLKMGLNMISQSFLNRLRGAEQQVLLRRTCISLSSPDDAPGSQGMDIEARRTGVDSQRPRGTRSSYSSSRARPAQLSLRRKSAVGITMSLL